MENKMATLDKANQLMEDLRVKSYDKSKDELNEL